MNHVEKAYLWGLCLALAENTTCKPGRVKSLLGRLRKETLERLKRLPPLKTGDIAGCQKKYSSFALRTGWDDKRITALTWANFLLTILDEAPADFDRAVEIISEIARYFERAGNCRPAQYWAAEMAGEEFLA